MVNSTINEIFVTENALKSPKQRRSSFTMRTAQKKKKNKSANQTLECGKASANTKNKPIH